MDDDKKLWEKYRKMDDHDKLTEIGVQVEIMQTKLTNICTKVEDYGMRLTRLETIVAVVAAGVVVGVPVATWLIDRM